MECFTNGGKCEVNAPQPYCACGFWYSDGRFSICSELWPGSYVLMSVSVALTVVLIGYVIYKIRAWRNSQHAKKERLLAYARDDQHHHTLASPVNSERQQLIASPTDFDQ